MPSSKAYWSEDELNLIETIKEYPILYTKKEPLVSYRYYTKARQAAFREVSRKTNWPAITCRRKFINLRLKYSILKNLIRSGDLTEKIIPKIPNLSKMLSGIFDFLDPHIGYIHDLQLPKKSKMYYKAILKAVQKASKDLKVKKITDKSNANKNDETNVQPITIMPKDEPMLIMSTDESENIVTETIFVNTIENATTHEETEEFILSDLNIPVYDDIVPVENSIVPIDGNIVPDVTPGPIQMFLMKYADDNNDGFDIKQYFNELAELLCGQLVLGKRQKFLNHIDLLVSKILEG